MQYNNQDTQNYVEETARVMEKAIIIRQQLLPI